MDEIKRAYDLAVEAGSLAEKLNALSYAKLDSIGFVDSDAFEREFIPLHDLMWRANKRYGRRVIKHLYLLRDYGAKHPN